MDLDSLEFDAVSAGKRPAPVSKHELTGHLNRRQLEAIAFMMRSAPKVVLQALPGDVEETKMHLIFDTGCQRTVAGSVWLKQAREELLRCFSLKCDLGCVPQLTLSLQGLLTPISPRQLRSSLERRERFIPSLNI